MNFFEILKELLAQSGFAALTWRSCVMILIAFVLLYLAIKKQFEPLLDRYVLGYLRYSASDCIWYVPGKPAVG